ncbi:alkaline phosphatase family protein [Pendulispora brunnea]|uniref:Alkaline phosphatase family protein n=1 Tax=Pendulispora brunnea TaxID=2905690 RepID=A0ABZ2KQH0_9BACT
MMKRSAWIQYGVFVSLSLYASGGCSSSDSMGDTGGAPDASVECDPQSGSAPPNDSWSDAEAPPSLSSLKHIVVIFMENHSFDNLYGSYPGAEGLSSAGAKIAQVDPSTGTPYTTLPQTDSNIPTDLPNAAFDITKYVPIHQATKDLTHRYYQEIAQINGGAMNLFVSNNSSKGLAFGYYPTSSLPVVKLIGSRSPHVTVCDHFFHAAFGGSFLNHQWLIAAATPHWEGCPSDKRAVIDASGKLTKDGTCTPDGYVVNTTVPTNQPTSSSGTKLPVLTGTTIGDQLTAAGIDWAWYSAGWNAAASGSPPSGFTFHHQPFVYYAAYASGEPGRAHLKDETDFVVAAKNGTLPPVSFVKPLGGFNEHPGANLQKGQEKAVELIEAVINGPHGEDTAVIVTYDENGGYWDHVAPPVKDKWGPGTRVPAIVFSKFARGGVDKTIYDTTSILGLIEKRWGLSPLNERVASQNDLASNAMIFVR